MSTLLAASLLPVVVLLIYIYRHDRYAKEPFGLLMKAFGGGVLAALTVLSVAALCELTGISMAAPPAGSQPVLETLYSAFCRAAIPEECCKLLFLYLIIWKNRHFDEFYDGIEYAVFVSLGFAGIENILYVMQGGMEVAVSRALFAVPAHCFLGILMGYFFSFAKFRRRHRKKYFFKCLFWPIMIHGIYDFIIMLTGVLNEINTAEAGAVSVVFYIFFYFVWRNAIKKVNYMSGR